jgi:4-amino-4-deoxy-L-arabinose transferase-like glycosyltransferase
LIVAEVADLHQQTRVEAVLAAPENALDLPRWLVLCAAVLAITCGLLIYAETMAFYWDEGFHVLAAQLIDAGSRPYLDFFFPQPPLNAYWTGAWIRVFGDSWRVVHAVSALATGAAVLLAADFVFRTFPVAAWRLAAGFTTALCCALNPLIVTYGTIGQAYALCLLLIVAAFRFCVEASERKHPGWAAAAGLTSGAAAACLLLGLPVGVVLLVWLIWCDRTGGTLRKSTAFILAAIVPFLPVGWLALQDFHQVFFDLIEYHLFYRGLGWSDALPHDADVMSSWFDSGHALLLIVLAVSAVLFVSSKDWPAADRSKYYLCAWLVSAEALWLCNIHPTFQQYFIFVVPFLAILAPVGLRALTLRFDSTGRPLWPVLLVGAFLAFGLEKSLFEQRDNLFWRDVESVAAKLNEVTGPAASLLADEFVYFASKRLPARGLEHADTHKLSLPAPLAARLGIISADEIKSRVTAGQFATVETCEADFAEWVGLKTLYRQSAQVKECTVYWDFDRSRASSPAQ